MHGATVTALPTSILTTSKNLATRRPPKGAQVVAHPGSATPQAVSICDDLGADLTLVTSLNDAYRVPMERLLLLGGADIHPWLYGQPRRSYTHCDTDRDKVEWALVRRAMAAQIPIFGICRGHQMITVAFGGTLHQDMADKLGTTHSGSHRIIVQGPLKEHIASRTVNSYHHQCTADVPLGFEIAAVAPDNVIESIYRPGVLGVQWHPEMMVRSDQRWLHLFRWFLEGQLDPAWDG